MRFLLPREGLSSLATAPSYALPTSTLTAITSTAVVQSSDMTAVAGPSNVTLPVMVPLYPSGFAPAPPGGTRSSGDEHYKYNAHLSLQIGLNLAVSFLGGGCFSGFADWID